MNIEKRKIELTAKAHEELVDDIINRELNDLVSGYADVKEDEVDEFGHGKRVPYIGWFWRSVDFANSSYTIGDCGDFIGFMENNKWGYVERRLTPDEAAKVTKIICKAHDLDHAGGLLSDVVETTQKKLAELWPLLQSFPMTVEGFWIHGIQGKVAFANTEAEANQMVAMLTDAAPGFAYRKVQA